MSHILLSYNIIIETLVLGIGKWFFADLKYIDSIISTSCGDKFSLILILFFYFLPWNWIYTSQMLILNDPLIHKICFSDLPYRPWFILRTGADVVTSWIKIKKPNSRKMSFHCEWAEPVINWFVKLPALYCVIITS